MIRMMSVFKAPAAATPHSFVVGYVFVFGGSCRSDLFFFLLLLVETYQRHVNK